LAHNLAEVWISQTSALESASGLLNQLSLQRPRQAHAPADPARIVDTFARLPATSVTLDVEGVACDPDGVTDFALLRAALGRPAKREVFLY
jgi:hypothetical protein